MLSPAMPFAGSRPAARQLVRRIFISSNRATRPIQTFTPKQLPSLRARPSQSIQWMLHQRRLAGSFTGNTRTLFRKHPFQMTLATGFIVFGIGLLVIVNHFYWTYIIGAFHNYPEEVAKPLRKALWYTNEDLQPKDALKYYTQALEKAGELKMDPVGDEVMGIRLQVAAMLERVHMYHKEVQLLERIRAENLSWLAEFGQLEKNCKRRTRVLAKTVQISVKLGEVYASPAIWDRATAQQHFEWAVETCLKEKQRRENKHVRDEDEGEWLSDAEFGASLEALAHSYEEKDQHYLAVPLFLHALRFHPATDCHTVVLMNNIATSLAQQNPHAAAAVQAYAESYDVNQRAVGPRATRESLVSDARQWAQKALDVAGGIKPPQRTEECDIGCAVTLHNLGEFAEMQQNFPDARQKYREAISLAKAIGFHEGLEKSAARLKALGQVNG